MSVPTNQVPIDFINLTTAEKELYNENMKLQLTGGIISKFTPSNSGEVFALLNQLGCRDLLKSRESSSNKRSRDEESDRESTNEIPITQADTIESLRKIVESQEKTVKDERSRSDALFSIVEEQESLLADERRRISRHLRVINSGDELIKTQDKLIKSKDQSIEDNLKLIAKLEKAVEELESYISSQHEVSRCYKKKK